MDADKTAAQNEGCSKQDIYYLESIDQLETLSDPIRYRMYTMLSEPKTGAQLARELGISRARAHYHLNILRDVGLVLFCGEQMSAHGITEKYYQGIADYLDFSSLMPKDLQDLVPNEVTLRSFTAAINFVSNLLDTSREGIAHLKVHSDVGIGFHYILNMELTPDQFALVKEDLIALKDRIIQMGIQNEREEVEAPVSCRVTLFMTPLSDELLAGEPEEKEEE